MIRVAGLDILRQRYSEQTQKLLMNNEKLFIKSMDKGYNAIIESRDLLEASAPLLCTLAERERAAPQQYLISEKVEFAKDHHGNLEVRFVVLNNELLNCSRYFHSLKHTVDIGSIDKAKEIAATMSMNFGFPENFILDVGCIITKDSGYIDVIEFNPVATSLCYVNNSIFTKEVKVIADSVKAHGFGKSISRTFTRKSSAEYPPTLRLNQYHLSLLTTRLS